jgi:multidrug resistance protein MdtO
MASQPMQIPRAESFGVWFPDFLKKEFAPYPGRWGLVARVVISATLTMILINTFRIPGGLVGTLTAFFFSRENLFATARSAFFLLAAFAVGTLFIPIGAHLFASTPETHFLWVGGTLFLTFFMLRCLTNYGTATGFALVVANVIGIWYLPGPAERNVELTLWLVLATLIGALVTLCVEVAFYVVYRKDDLLDGLDARLASIEELMASYADSRPVSRATQASLAQFAVVGAGALRRRVTRANFAQAYRTRMATLIALVGRCIDFAAGLAGAFPSLPGDYRDRAERIRRSLADIRQCLRTHGQPCETALEPKPSPGTPMMSEIESMVSLMPSIFSREHAPDPGLEPIEETSATSRIFVADAFSNPEHLRFILGGTLAAMLCYVFYVALDWPGLSTSVTTCVLTAVSTIGASRQKQILRIGGFILGGVIAGIGSQIFILPYIDTIGGFAVLFACMTAVAAWIGTASSKVSYAGLQFAFAYYTIQLSDFSFLTNLTVARDRVLGVLLGVTMMWLVFERFDIRSAADEMVRIFIVNVRLLADLSSSSARADRPAEVVKVRRQREEIYRHFGEVTAQSDAVPFQTGSSRARDMAARDRIRRWQTSLRSFYLLEIPLLQFRIFGSTDSRSRPFAAFEDQFRLECARIFRWMADSLESQMSTHTHRIDTPASLLEHVDSTLAPIAATLSEGEQNLLRVIRTIAQLVDRLQSQVASEGLYDLPRISPSLPADAEPESA